MKDLPSEEELFANRMKDGSRPPMHSKELYDKHVVDGFGRPLPEQLRDKTPQQSTALELQIAIEERRLRNYNRIEAAGNYLMDLGYDVLANDISPGGHGRESAPSADDNEKQSSTQQPDETTSSSADAPEDMGEDTHATSADTDSHAETATGPSHQAVRPSPGRQAGEVTDDDHDSDDSSASDYGDSPQSRGQSPTAQSPAANSPVRGGGVFKIPSIPSPSQPKPKGRPLRRGEAVVPDTPTKRRTEDEKFEAIAVEAQDLIHGYQRGDYPRTSGPRKPRGGGKLTAKDGTNLIYTGSKLLAMVTDKRAECALRLVELTQQQDIKEAFYWDRAHAVIAATLLHLDEEFESIGFGSWMPFRFPDQWLMFCGLMRRVLAANGLLHGTDPEQYRRLLEETPYPTPAIENIDERIKWWKTPQNWSTLWLNRGAETMDILKQRLQDEVWDPTTEFGGTRAPPDNPYW